jgi:hypothetical protein
MFGAMTMNSMYTNEYANLMNNYNSVCLLVKDLCETIKNLEIKIQVIERNQETENQPVIKRCNYYNTGFCKNRRKCPSFHPDSICQVYLDSGKCEEYRTCQKRHPKECRYWRDSGKCFKSCAYLHKTVDLSRDQTEEIYVQDVFESHETDENAEEIAANHDEAVDEMTVDDIIKFYEDEKNVFTEKDLEKYCGIAHEEVVAKPNENVTTKAKIIKPQKIVLTKSTKKKLKIKPTK